MSVSAATNVFCGVPLSETKCNKFLVSFHRKFTACPKGTIDLLLKIASIVAAIIIYPILTCVTISAKISIQKAKAKQTLQDKNKNKILEDLQNVARDLPKKIDSHKFPMLSVIFFKTQYVSTESYGVVTDLTLYTEHLKSFVKSRIENDIFAKGSSYYVNKNFLTTHDYELEHLTISKEPSGNYEGHFFSQSLQGTVSDSQEKVFRFKREESKDEPWKKVTQYLNMPNDWEKKLLGFKQ